MAARCLWAGGEGLGGTPAKTWWFRSVGERTLWAAGFKHLRFSPARHRTPRLGWLASAAGGELRASMAGLRLSAVSERGPMSRRMRCRSCGSRLITSRAVGDGAGCRENLRCLKLGAHKVMRIAKPSHIVFPAPGSVHGRVCAGR
jgi:hypothetical protein